MNIKKKKVNNLKHVRWNVVQTIQIGEPLFVFQLIIFVFFFANYSELSLHVKLLRSYYQAVEALLSVKVCLRI